MSQGKEQLIIEAHADAVKLVRLRWKNAQLQCVDRRLLTFEDVDPEKSALQSQLILDEIQRVFEDSDWNQKDEVTFLIGGGVAACHYFRMPPLAGKELFGAVKLKLAQQMHLPIEDAIVDIDVVSGSNKKAESVLVRAVALNRAVSEAAIEFANSLAIQCPKVTTVVTALHTFADETVTSVNDVHATLYIDRKMSTLMVTGPDGPILTTEIPVGEQDFVAALMRPIISGDDMLQLDEASAADLWADIGIPKPGQFIEAHGLEGRSLLPLFEPVLQRFAQQLIQWLTFAATTDDGINIERVTLVGQAADVAGLPEALASRLDRDVGLVPWLTDAAVDEPPTSDADVSAAIGAVACAAKLPNLISPREKSARRVRRFFKSTTIIGPMIAAAVLGFAFLINQTSGGLQSAAGDVDQNMTRLREAEARNEQLLAQRNTVRRMQTKLDSFSQATPNWLGLLKELSMILPNGVAIERLTGREVGGRLRIAIEALARETTATAPCDQMIEQTLRALEKSPFSKEVYLLNVSRSDSRVGQKTARLNVEMDLAYRVPMSPDKEAQP